MVTLIPSLAKKLSRLHAYKKNRYLLACFSIILLLIALSVSVYGSTLLPDVDRTSSTNEISNTTEQGVEDALNTIQPELVSGSASTILLGTVVSNETANIFPRRNGIIEDIYVDIGDTVKKNQVIALMLSKGVQGESYARIREKQVLKKQAESDLDTTKQVANETIINAKQKIKEKETELLVAERKQEQTLKKFAESESQIQQMRDQAYSSIKNIRQSVVAILDPSPANSNQYLNEDDVPNNIGQLDSGGFARLYVVEAYNNTIEAEKEYMSTTALHKEKTINTLISQSQEMLSYMINVLNLTPSTIHKNNPTQYSGDELNTHITTMNTAQDTLLKLQERIQDAQSSFETLVAAEPELYRAYRSGNTEGHKSNEVRTIETAIQSEYNNVNLTEANQEKMIEMKQRQIDIADAMLQSEYVQSGDRQIRSPFSGVVSKRFIEVGQIASSSSPVMELTSVATSLAKKAKTELQFGLPEDLQSAITIGSEVKFYIQADETTPYTATVTRKSPQVDLETRTITVQAKIPDEVSLPHRSSVRIRLFEEQAPVFKVPSATVKRSEDGNHVWVLDPTTGEPVQISVTVNAEEGEFAEITGTITSESLIIVDPPTLFDLPTE